MLNRLLLLATVLEGALLLCLVVWLGYLHFSLANLPRPLLVWGAGISAAIVVATIAWQSFKFGWRLRFQFGLRTLLITTCVLGTMLAGVAHYLNELRVRHLAESAISHILARNGVVTIGSPTGASDEARTDWTDLRNAVSVSFSGTTLDETDLEELARVPSLVAITLKNAPIREKDFLLLRTLPNLKFLVFENTGTSDVTLEKIDNISPKWRVFRSQDEMKQWSLARVRKLKASGEL